MVKNSDAPDIYVGKIESEEWIMSDCKLCNGNFDFRKVQINEILGETGISFTPRLNELTEEYMFKFCPLF